MALFLSGCLSVYPTRPSCFGCSMFSIFRSHPRLLSLVHPLHVLISACLSRMLAFASTSPFFRSFCFACLQCCICFQYFWSALLEAASSPETEAAEAAGAAFFSLFSFPSMAAEGTVAAALQHLVSGASTLTALAGGSAGDAGTRSFPGLAPPPRPVRWKGGGLHFLFSRQNRTNSEIAVN